MKRTKLILPVAALVIAGSAGATWLTTGATAAGTLPTGVTTACDHGHRLYVGKQGESIAVVPRDDTCPQPTPTGGSGSGGGTTRPPMTTKPTISPSTTRPPVVTTASTSPPADPDTPVTTAAPTGPGSEG